MSEGAQILDMMWRALKLTVVVLVSAIFLLAILLFLGFIHDLVFGSFVGEFFALISMYLPFNALVVFGSIGTAIIAILSFLIAKKIFDLTSWSISTLG